MLLGIPNNPSKNLFEEIKRIKKLKFDYIELYLSKEIGEFLKDKKNMEKFVKIVKKYKLGVPLAHLHEKMPFGHPDKEIREKMINILENTIFPILQDLNISLVTIHTALEDNLGKNKAISILCKELREVKKIGKRFGITLMLEPRSKPLEIILFEEILERSGIKKVTFDAGHFNLFGRNPIEAMKRLKKKIAHVHLHDNNRKDDLHLPIGVGKINWLEFVKELKKFYNGTFTFEIFSAKDERYILLSKKIFLEIWEMI